MEEKKLEFNYMLIFQLKKMRSIKSANWLASEVPASVAVKEKG